MSKLNIGSSVKYQNLYGTVVGFDGDAVIFQPKGSSQRISVKKNMLVQVVNESTNLKGYTPMNS